MTLIRFYKPFGVLSQFRDPARPTLADFIDLPGVYPAGRLDRDSEGLMLLTDDGVLQARIAEPSAGTAKHYWVQVEARPEPGQVAELAARLRHGVTLRDGPARALALTAIDDPGLPAREPPVTPHRAARGRWLEVSIDTGRNRLVRRMLAAVGLPVLRLHRTRIGGIGLDGLQPGEWAVVPAAAATELGSAGRGSPGRNRGASGSVARSGRPARRVRRPRSSR